MVCPSVAVADVEVAWRLANGDPTHWSQPPSLFVNFSMRQS